MIKDFSTLRNSTAFKVAVAAFISFIFYLLGNFLLPILLAVGLAFLLHPVTKLFGKITLGRGTIHLSRVVTILMAFVAFGVIVFCAVTFIILPLFGQINALVGKIPDYTTKMDAATFDWLLEDPANYPRLPHNIESLFDYITSWLMGFVAAVLRRNLLKSTLDIIANLVGLIVVPFLAFYFLKDWRDLRAMLINFFSYEAQPRVAHIIDEIGITLSCYIQGLARLSLIAGFCIAVGTTILGIHYPLVFGLLAILAEMVPGVGPLIGAVPAVFIAYSQSPQSAFYVALFYLVFYQFDANVLMPRIIGKYGILGMLFAVPVAAVYRVLYKELWHSTDEALEEATPAQFDESRRK